MRCRAFGFARNSWRSLSFWSGLVALIYGIQGLRAYARIKIRRTVTRELAESISVISDAICATPRGSWCTLCAEPRGTRCRLIWFTRDRYAGRKFPRVAHYARIRRQLPGRSDYSLDPARYPNPAQEHSGDGEVLCSTAVIALILEFVWVLQHS